MDANHEFNLNSEFLNRILILLQKYYHPFDISQFYGNYFFFNGESESSIIIQNRAINIKENKKILNFDDKLYLLLFIKSLKTDNDKKEFNIIKIKLTEKNKESEISIGLDQNNNFNVNLSNCPIIGNLSQKETNCIFLKLKKRRNLK